MQKKRKPDAVENGRAVIKRFGDYELTIAEASQFHEFYARPLRDCVSIGSPSQS